MISSSGSAVSDEQPSRFRYHQDGAMIWGEYAGDTVAVGRFVGRREGDTLTVCFTHSPASGVGDVVMGIARSVLRRGDDGRLYLDETFEKDGDTHESACVEVAADLSWPEPRNLRAPEARTSPMDGASFVLEHSTASTVSPTDPTRFDFEESTGVVWGSYSGDTVTSGHCVGRFRDGALEEYFVHHVRATDATLLGDSSSTLQRRDDGRLELIENFVLDGVPGYSVCVQSPRSSESSAHAAASV